jgi:hypothetical protein
VILFNFELQSTFSQLQNLNSMRISRTKFVTIFLVSAFVFQFISNSLLGPEVRLFPANGEFFPGADSPIAWKSTLATILYPVKIVLIGPLSFLAKDPDPAPPGFGYRLCFILDSHSIDSLLSPW